jgi:hypothetical protein
MAITLTTSARNAAADAIPNRGFIHVMVGAVIA